MPISKAKWTIGCDPEILLRDRTTGQLVSAEGLIPGDKLNPHKVKKGTIQVDGFAAEIGIDPASDANEFADNVETVLSELRVFLPNHDFIFTDSAVYSDEVYMKQSEQGRMLGCEPDFCAWTKRANEPPVPDPSTFRTFSGHIHIGWCNGVDITDPAHFADCLVVTKQMDWALGAPSVYMNPKSKRRVLYGKAGAFRPKPYGAEYRTPDNSWLRSRDAMKLMFTNSCKGMDDLYAGKHYNLQYDPRNFVNSGVRSTLYKPEQIPNYLARFGLGWVDVEPIGPLTTPKRRVRKKKVVEGEEAVAVEVV